MKKFVGLLVVMGGVHAFGIGNLQPLEGWEEVASGVWKAQVGDADQELSYTSLSAREPRIDALNALPQVDFPFSGSLIEFRKRVRKRVSPRI